MKKKKRIAGQGSLYIRIKKDFQFATDEHMSEEDYDLDPHKFYPCQSAPQRLQ